MKVLHVIPAIAACYGGPSKVVLDTCKALREAGIDAEIATTNADEDGDLVLPVKQPASIDGVPVYFFRRHGSLRYKISWGLTRWLANNVRHYDLAHIHAVFSYSTSAAAFYARRAGVPYLIVPHGMLNPWPLRQNGLLKSVYLTAIERRNLTGAAAVHFAVDTELSNSVIKGRANLALPYVLDLPILVNSHAPLRAKPQILFLSRLDPKKGIELLIQVLIDLAQAGHEFEFVIAGSGAPPYEEHLKRMISASAKLAAATSFVGFVEGTDKMKLLQSSDLFVLPSFDENFGIAVTEAMAAGLAIIISDQINIHDEIEKAAAGLVVSRTLDSLCEGILKLLTDPELRAEMARNGRELVRNRFSPEAITQETIRVYEDVINNSRHSAAWKLPMEYSLQ
jgi:glycosyltransferase involved in cell wall biosynthesis